jgi:type IV pilus assembly protein PilO
MAKGFKDLPVSAQTIILVILALAAVIVPSYFYIYPMFPEKSQKETQLTGLEAEVRELQAIEQRLADYQAQIKAHEAKLETLRSIVPDTPEMDRYLKLVYADAGGTSIHVRTFIPKPQVQQKYYVEMPVEIRIDGTYWQMVSFFDRLAREQRIVSVTSIGLGPPVGGGMGAYEVGSNETVGANCVVTTYYNRPAQPAAPAGGAGVRR